MNVHLSKIVASVAALLKPAAPAPSTYFVVDDVLSTSPREGFIVMYGNPHSGIGVSCGEYRTLRECKGYLRDHMVPGETAHRVRLARRHGEHSVRVLLTMPAPDSVRVPTIEQVEDAAHELALKVGHGVHVHARDVAFYLDGRNPGLSNAQFQELQELCATVVDRIRNRAMHELWGDQPAG